MMSGHVTKVLGILVIAPVLSYSTTAAALRNARREATLDQCLKLCSEILCEVFARG